MNSFYYKQALLLFGDIALICLATYFAPFFRTGDFKDIFTYHTGASVFSLTLYLINLYVFDLYNVKRDFLHKDFFLRLAMAVIIGSVLSASTFYIFPQWKFSTRGFLVIQAILVIIFLYGWRWVYWGMFRISWEKHNTIIVGAGRCGRDIFNLLRQHYTPYNIVGFLDDDPKKQGMYIDNCKVLGFSSDLLEFYHNRLVKTAIVAITHDRSEALVDTILKAKFSGVDVIDMPTVYEEITNRVPVDHIRDDWLLFVGGFYIISKDYIRNIKRFLDIALSTFLLLLLLPVFAVTAVAIKVDSKGTVFYRQKRVGKENRTFVLWKFRSMCENAECNGAVWACEADTRITKVGRWIRKLRIDELPQLINVLKGDMSLIGPRPERPEFVKDLDKQIPFYYIRHTVCPGITGWAQVSYPYGASVEDAKIKLEYDLYYIKNMSLLLDIKIILRTIGVVILGQGAR